MGTADYDANYKRGVNDIFKFTGLAGAWFTLWLPDMKAIKIKKLQDLSYNLRKSVLVSAKRSGGRGAHLGGTMSCIDILICLYFSKKLKYFKNNPKHP